MKRKKLTVKDIFVENQKIVTQVVLCCKVLRKLQVHCWEQHLRTCISHYSVPPYSMHITCTLSMIATNCFAHYNNFEDQYN